MTDYFNQDGERISRDEGFALFESADARRVASTRLPDGKWVSTVHLVFDHSFGDGPPLIFETMVFRNEDDMGELDVERYATREEALAGHEAMVQRWSEEVVR